MLSIRSTAREVSTLIRPFGPDKSRKTNDINRKQHLTSLELSCVHVFTTQPFPWWSRVISPWSTKKSMASSALLKLGESLLMIISKNQGQTIRNSLKTFDWTLFILKTIFFDRRQNSNKISQWPLRVITPPGLKSG